MLSVALDEALSLRQDSELTCARQQARVAAGLSGILESRISAVLRALEEHGRHFGSLPAVTPLDGEFFRGLTTQSTVRWHSLVELVLLSSRLRFFHKLETLARLVESLTLEFRRAAEELAGGQTIRPGDQWQLLDDLHYDLNTCLQESKVMLKSFLRVLPAEQVDAFRLRLAAQPAAPLTGRVHVSGVHT
jgi:hypothetical protein